MQFTTILRNKMYHRHLLCRLSVIMILFLSWSFVIADTSYSSYSCNTIFPNRTRASLNKHNLNPKTSNFGIVVQNRSQKNYDKSTKIISSLRGGISLYKCIERFNVQTYSGASFFILLDILFRQLFIAFNISFPSQLGGCCIFFLTLLFLENIIPGLGDYIFTLTSPGAKLLMKWLPVFFVPGLAMLPFAPSIGSRIEVIKVLATILIGFYFSLSTTAFSVLYLRKLQGYVTSITQSSTSFTHKIQTKLSPFSDEFLKCLLKSLLVSGFACISAVKSDSKFTTPLRTIFMILTTLTGFVLGTHLPFKITQVIHPIVSATCFTLFMTLFTCIFTGETFLSALSTYRINSSLSPLIAGAGDYLLYMINPAVISLSLAMYGQRQIASRNIGAVMLCMVISSAGSMFGTAFFVRLLNFSKDIVSLSLLSRNVTTPLAIAIANILHADVSLTISVVILSGLFGSTVGVLTLNKLKITDPVSRGLSIGASAQSVGVASISNETEAFPFAAISMILTAVSATTLASIPVVKEMLVEIATAPNISNVMEKTRQNMSGFFVQ